ncbi:MAG: TolC family protein [Planctomycetaceae bacterium]
MSSARCLFRALGCLTLAGSTCFAQNPVAGHSIRANSPPRIVRNAVHTRVLDGSVREPEIDLIRYGNQPAAQRMPTAPDQIAIQPNSNPPGNVSPPQWQPPQMGAGDFSGPVVHEMRLPDGTVNAAVQSTDSIVALQRPVLWWEKELRTSILRERPPMPMSLNETLYRAMTEAPELKILNSDWCIQLQEVTRQDAAFDWTTFVNSVWNRDSTPVGSQLDGAARRLLSRTSSARAGLRRLDRTGGKLEIAQQFGFKESNSQFISPNNQGNSRLTLQYEKSLLRGAGEDYATSPLQLAEIDKDIAFDRLQTGIQEYLLETANAYWTLVLRRGRFLQAVNSWNRAKLVADEISQRQQIDVKPVAMDRAMQDVANRLAAAIQAEHDIIVAQEVLLSLIYANRYPQFAGTEVVPLTLPPHSPETIGPETQVEVAIQNRSEVHQVIREIRAAAIEHKVAQSDVLPALNLVLTGYSAGLRGSYDATGAFVDQFGVGQPGVGVGLDFEIPYRNRAAQAAAEQRRIAMARIQNQFEVVVGEVSQDVRSQAIQRNKFIAVLPQQWESLILSQRLLENTETRRRFLADGTQVADLYLDNLLQIQSRLEASEFAMLQAQVNFAMADMALQRSVANLRMLATSDATGQVEFPGAEMNQRPIIEGQMIGR